MTRIALVTGGAKRIGRSIVDQLALDGWDIAVHHHSSTDEAEEVVQSVPLSWWQRGCRRSRSGEPGSGTWHCEASD